MSETHDEQSAPPVAEAPHEPDEPDETGDEHEQEQPATPGEPAADEDEDEAHEHDEQQAQEQEPEQPQALSQKQLEQAFGKLERETERHAKRVQEIMGDDAAMLLACPLCDPLIPGFIMPTPATPERFPEVRQFMGDAQPADYQADPNTRQCQTCHGWGMVETGSKVEGQVTLVCTYCGGKGWQGSRAPIATTGPTTFTPPAEGNGHDVQAAPTIDPPEIAELKRQGYVIIEPPKVTA